MKANWELTNDHYYCSKCKRQALPREEDEDGERELNEYLTPFCPFCGSEMYDVSVWDTAEELHRKK